jgi:hypothetical protein
MDVMLLRMLLDRTLLWDGVCDSKWCMAGGVTQAYSSLLFMTADADMRPAERQLLLGLLGGGHAVVRI